MRSTAAKFGGGVASKLAPSLVGLLLIRLVAQEGTLDDVGRLGLATATAYLCGSLAEMGMMTSLSLPQEYFGVAAPPLRATRTARSLAAAAGSALYGVLWLAGLGGHEPILLLALPLPFLLALSYGYIGAMNAGGALNTEGAIAAGEAVAAVVLTVVLGQTTSTLAAALVALGASKWLGTLARLLALRGLPKHAGASVPGVVRQQLWFLTSGGATVLHGRLDLLVLGFGGPLSLVGIYSTLLRACYSTFLVAEGLTLAMYSTEEAESSSRAVRRWRVTGLVIGLVAGTAFLIAAGPLLPVILDRPIENLLVPIILLAVLIPVRFAGYVQSIDLVRAGRQAARIPVLVVALAVLLVGGIVGWRTGSLTWLAGLRLASEAVVTLGFLYLARRGLGALRGVRPRLDAAE